MKNFILNIMLVCSALTLSAQSVDLSKIPGYVDPTGSNTCFDYMGAVSFTPRYSFVSSYTGSSPAGWDGRLLNPSARRLYGFTVPLVGDLNGDGYPEIVAIGITDSQSGLNATSRYIYIYNGQTGKELSRFTLPTTWNNRANYYHGSPSQLALVDVDRDGTKEIIVATGSSSDATYGKRLIAYSVNKTNFQLTEKWISSERYNTPYAVSNNTFFKAIPQVVDLDGDGIPEIVVYNKVYNAVNGQLLLTLETLDTTTNGSEAYVGRDPSASVGDGQINFNYVYDMDLDGIYDIVAGGKVYKITKENGVWKYTIRRMTGVPDGRTGVADINGDGIPDVVSVTRADATKIDITVWNPGYFKLDASGNIVEDTGVPSIIAQYKGFPLRDPAVGNNSHVYIGDIDGRETTYNGKTYRFPEIAVLGGKLNYGTLGTANVYPGISGFPTSGSGSSGIQGVLTALTFDPTATSTASKLKLSFALEHDDNSGNTGFTMFDFDNDGTQEICYRDQETIRIIKASTPYVKLKDTNATLFNYPCRSYTGFEYPVIADLDNDASVDMVVTGNNQSGNDDYAFLYAISTGGDKFTPALKVWNQFMYDPFKINEDLTTPIGKAPNRLAKEYTFTKIIRNDLGVITKKIENYKPFNGTLTQAAKFQLNNTNEFEPVVFLTEAYIVQKGESANDAKKPIITTSGGKNYINIWVGNRATAKTDISPNTPIAIYKNGVSKTIYKKVTLASLGVTTPIKAGDEPVMVSIEVDVVSGFFVLRLGDDSRYNASNQVTEWKWGTNTPNIQDATNFVGTATRAFRDCSWTDQEVKVGKLALTNDAYTMQEFKTKLNLQILNNDLLPDDFVGGFDGASPSITITSMPKGGILTTSGSIDIENETNTIKVDYQSTNSQILTEGIDMFTYQITYKDATSSQTLTQTANVYLYILQNQANGFTACVGDNFTVRPKQLPIGTQFYWYNQDGTQIGSDPKPEHVISSINGVTHLKVKPIVPSTNSSYGLVNFPIGDLSVQTIAIGTTLQWTGNVNSDWYNPLNWKEKGTGSTIYTPSNCVDIEIPKVATNYPVLDEGSSANNVSLADRAMIKNVHMLNCSSVDWSFSAKSTETNKWLSLVSPLSNMYSGDYIILDTQGKEIYKSAYLLFYQDEDPDRQVVVADNEMTRPFAKIGVPLSLNKPFFLYIDAKYFQSLDAKYKFPTGKTTFTYRKNNVIGAPVREEQSQETLTRAANNKEKFSLFEASGFNSTDGSLTISYTRGRVLYVANPYPAMLNIDDFVLANSNVLELSHRVWDGNGDGKGNFIEIKRSVSAAPTLAIKKDAVFNTAVAGGTTMVAPFQGFFVKLKAGVNYPVTLKFLPSQTSVNTIDYTY